MEENNQFINQQTSEQQPVQQPAQQPMYAEPAYVGPVVPYKEKKSPAKWFILGGVVLLAAAIVAIVLILLNSNSQSSYEKAERGYFGALASSVENFSDNVKPTHTELNANFDLASLTGSYADLPEEAAALLEQLSSFSLTTDTAIDGKNMMSQYALSIGGSKLFDGTMWLKDGNSIVMQFPEITKYLLTTIANAPATTSETSESDIKIIENALNSISDVYFDFVSKFKPIANQSFTANSTTYTGDLVQIRITYSDVLELAKQICAKLSANDEFCNLISKFSGSTTGITDIKASLDSIANGGLDSLKSLVDESTLSQTLLSMDVYMNGDKIVNREINVLDTVIIQIFDVNDGTNFDAGMTLTVPQGNISASLTNSCTKSDDSYTGALELTFATAEESFNASADYNNFSVTENGCNGTINIHVPAITMDIALSFDSATKTSTGTFSVGGKQVATITGTTSDSTLAYQPAPEVNDDNAVVISSTGLTGKADEFQADIEAYIQKLSETNPLIQSLITSMAISSVIPSDDFSDIDFSDFGEF